MKLTVLFMQPTLPLPNQFWSGQKRSLPLKGWRWGGVVRPPPHWMGTAGGGGGAAPPPWMGTVGGVVRSPPWNGNSWGGVVHLPWSEGKLGVVDIQAFEVRDGAFVVQEEDTSKAGGGAWAGLEQGWGGWCTPLAWMKVDAKWRTLWCPSWSSWGGTLEFCEPYWIIPRIVTHQSRPLWECLPNAFLYFLTAFHHCTGVCIIN